MSTTINRLFWPLALLIFAYTLFKTLTAPSIYISPHYLFSYENGLMKRGLIGEITRWYFGEERFFYVSTIKAATTISLTFIFALFAIIATMPARLRWASLPLLASPAILALGAFNGFLEYAQYALLAVFLLSLQKINSSSSQRLALFIYGIICILIHEAALATVIPVACLAMTINLWSKNGIEFGKSILYGASTFLTLFLISALYSFSLTIDINEALQLYNSIAAKTDYRPYRVTFEILSYTSSDNLFIGMFEFLKKNHLLYFTLMASMTIPYLFLYITIAKEGFKHINTRKKITLILTGILVSISPLGLSLIGTDLPRWIGLVLLNCLFVFWIFTKYFPSTNENMLTTIAITSLTIFGLSINSFPLLSAEIEPKLKPPQLISALLNNDLKSIPAPINPILSCRVKSSKDIWCDEDSYLHRLQVIMSWENTEQIRNFVADFKKKNNEPKK